MISATSIATVTVSGGTVNVSFVGSKQGIQFDSIESLKAAVAHAKEVVKEQEFLIVMGLHLDADPTLSNTTPLSGKLFYEGKTAIGAAAGMAADFLA